MTKSTITREQLLEIIETDHVQCGEASYLARMALAAMDSEPVAYISKSDFDAGYPHILARRDFNKACTMAVYAAQPAPVAPACTCPSGDGSLRWPCSVHPGNSPAQSDCCPAQNSVSPAQSHGWIPVSERMPIEFEAVIAFDGDQVYGEAMYSSDDGFTIDGYEPCDRLNLRNVTHWMPLPAAPQEVNRE